MIQYNKGDKFGNLTFIEEDFHEKEVTGYQSIRKAVVQCFCGRKFITRISGLKNGKVKSCGCVQKHKLRIKSLRHNMSDTTEYTSWEAMKSRCLNSNNISYSNYGGRGIKICERWLNFREFYKDMGDKPGKNYSLERIDVNGDYTPENCRWATKYDQDRNRRSNVYLKYNGEDKILTDISKETGVHHQTIKSRMETGLSIEDATSKSHKYVKSGKYTKT